MLSGLFSIWILVIGLICFDYATSLLLEVEDSNWAIIYWTIVVIFLGFYALFIFFKYRRISSKHDIYSINELSNVTWKKKVITDLRVLILISIFSSKNKKNLQQFLGQCETESNVVRDQEIDRLYDLYKKGLITNEEFVEAKDKLIDDI